jgi:hypothetical protein
VSFDDIKNIAALIAVIVGIASGLYAFYQNHQKAIVLREAADATEVAKREAQRLSDKSAAVSALENAVHLQGAVIEGLTKGLEDCIERDNAKAVEINELRTHDAEKTWEIERLKRKVAALEART